ncbi:DENND1A [Cordylochernes scorpioides]|uniref:DENND1A n=1 Tax=Cordylochernes scorpioides TaxID=51811 RepID=A0ABY6KPH2_9ARAC|nr:DENND1A [Cordylochernes scorpioides]
MAACRQGILQRFLEDLYHYPVPEPGNLMHLFYNQRKNSFIVKCDDHLLSPTIPEDRNLTEYFRPSSISNLITVFVSMLHERRIILTSANLPKLSACVQAANALLYPMQWQHIFVTVLPPHLIDYLQLCIFTGVASSIVVSNPCEWSDLHNWERMTPDQLCSPAVTLPLCGASAPMPYVIGVPLSILNTKWIEDLGDVVVYHLDKDRVVTPFDDVESIPAHIEGLFNVENQPSDERGEQISELKRSLKTPNAQFGDGVAHAFLVALVHLIGGYRESLKLPLDGDEQQKITFDAEAFIKSRPSALKPFLHNVLTFQIFQQFIEGRLEMLNSGEGFSDRFEQEVNRYEAIVNSWVRAQYKDWFHNVKKGGALLKKMKKKSRRAYKDLRGKIQDLQLQQPKPPAPQPHSAPSSPTQSRPLQLNFAKEEGLQAALEDLKSTAKRDVIARNYEQLEGGEEDAELEDIKFEPINMDLMGDLQDLIFRRHSSDSSEKKDQACSLPPPPGKRKSGAPQEPLLIKLEEDDVLLDPLESSSSPQSTFYCPIPQTTLDPFDLPPWQHGSPSTSSWQTFH